jgi:Uncharacterized protein conserved in bacteria
VKARWIKLIAFLLVALAIGSGLYLVPKRRSFDSYLDRAEVAFQKKNFNRSIELYLRALKLYSSHPRTPEVLLRIGDTYNFSLANPQKAGTAYEMLTTRFPKSPEARQAFERSAEMYEKNGDYQKALLAYQGVIDNFPDANDLDEFRYNVAMMALKLKKFEPARRALMAIVEKNPQTPIADKVIYQLGNAFFMDAGSRQAVEVLKVAVEKYPDSPLKPDMLFTLANAYEELGEFPTAMKIYKSILNIYPNPKVVEKKIEKLEKRGGDVKQSKEQVLKSVSLSGGESKPSASSKGAKKTGVEKKPKAKTPDFIETPSQVEP